MTASTRSAAGPRGPARCATAVAVVALAGGIVGAQALLHGSRRGATDLAASPPADAGLPATAPQCPTAFDPVPVAPPGRGGSLVPAGGARAMLCAYQPAPGGFPPRYSVAPYTADRGVDAVTASLNGLPDHAAMLRRHPDRAFEGCLMADRTQYRLVIEYPGGRPPATVDLDMNCATASREGMVRYRDLVTVLDRFGDGYRASGGTERLPTRGAW